MSIRIKDVVIGEKPLICAPVISTSVHGILEECKKICNQPVDMVEWRVDMFERCDDIEAVLDTLEQIVKVTDRLPIIFTCRTINEGGQYALGEEAYCNLLNEVAKQECADIIDVEICMLGDKVASRLINGIKTYSRVVIGSNHHFHETPSNENIRNILATLDECGADILKLAVMPDNENDVIRLMSATSAATSRYDKPIVTMSMGKLGEISRVTGGYTGSAITFASGGGASAPGQIEAGRLRNILDMLEGKEYHNIFLVGFMGCGKSTISSVLASCLGMKEIDTDAYIENEQGMKIADIFKGYGEKYFRELETAFLEKLPENDSSVIACGGGMAVNEYNVSVMKKCGKVVMLDATPETIYNRVKHSNTRPLLNGNMNVEYIANLLEARKPFYERAYDVKVSTDGRSKEQIAYEIINGIVML